MGLSVEEVAMKLEVCCSKWAAMAFNAFIVDLECKGWTYTLDWQTYDYANDMLVITTTDSMTIWRHFVPISSSGCTTEREILRARDSWKEFLLDMDKRRYGGYFKFDA